MDLWQALARLRERPWLIALVAALSLALGVIGWASTRSTYSISVSHVLRMAAPQAGEQPRYAVGSYESGMLAAMTVSNLNTVGSGVADTTVTANNSIVSPPTMLPLITITVTAESPEEAVAAVDGVLKVNRDFLNRVAGTNTGLTLEQVNPTHPAVESSQPRIRAAGSGAILGVLFGTLALLVFDTLSRLQASRRARRSASR
ncbi:MAG: hypothetical protein Q4G51_06965 [Dermatophilus congolensis]|nr:hypothetical protein [Dermatophilus congolensis]